MITKTVTIHLLIISGIGQYVNKRKHDTYSTTIVNARPKINFPNSINFSLKVIAPE